VVDFAAAEELRVTLWLRDTGPGGSEGGPSVGEQLRDLEEKGVIDSLTINTWPRQLPCDPDSEVTGSAATVRKRLAEFREWATERGHDLEPAFRWCERTSLVSETAREVVVLPMRCIEVRDGDELLAVFPCTGDQGVNTVSSCLARLAGLLSDDEANGEPPQTWA